MGDKIILVVICAITTMANLGINVAPFLAGAGVIGLAIGFGSQQLVQDVITGLFIIIEDTLSIGDWVVLDSGHAGTVEGLTIRTLRLRDGKGFRALGAVRPDQGRDQPIAAVCLRVLLGAVHL